jgi:hypothetical protein
MSLYALIISIIKLAPCHDQGADYTIERGLNSPPNDCEATTMRISIIDILFLIAFTLWIITLDFQSLSPLQIVSLIVMGSWLLFIVFRLLHKKA